MRLFGLTGFPLSHSFSKKYFEEKFVRENIQECRYELFPLENIHLFPELIKENPSLCGMNVTIPHKSRIIPYLDMLSPEAQEIGAVNCISIMRNKGIPTLTGHNTDAVGFERSLRSLLRPWHSRALILGNGGAAKAISYVLDKLCIPFLTVTRDKELTYASIDQAILAEHTLLINTTPLGMYPETASYPEIPYQFLTGNHLAYDLVYNPAETQFLKKAALQGAAVKNGLEMLRLQAEESWYIWNQ